MSQISTKLPLREKASVTSVKFPLFETAWVIEGFIIRENIIEWKITSFNLIENIKSRINIDLELVDNNHVKIKWFGESVPKILIYKKLDGEEFMSTPIATLNWSPQEYIVDVDSNGYGFKLVGIYNSGESDELSVGSSQRVNIDMDSPLPLNEKYYYFNIEVFSEYRIEVNV